MILSPRLGWIGVDVGTHTVKLAQAVRTAGGPRLHRAAVIQRRASWSGDDSLAREQPIASDAEISAALECGGFTGRNAVCTLPMNVCQLRGLNVPPGTDRERRTMIADELADEWAEKQTPMEFDFWELEPAKGAETFNVNMLAASRPWVSQLWHDCRQTGLDCWAVDGVPLAMARAVRLAGGNSGGRRTLAVDWGFSNTTLCIVGDDRPLYTRRVHESSFGLVLDTIMDGFGVTPDEAQHLADTQGLSGVDSRADQQVQAAITDAAADAIEELTREIGRTLHFMDTQRRHPQPAAIWLMGGGASLRNVGPFLANLLQLPVHVWNMVPDSEPIPCAAGNRSAIFAGAMALSALAWRAA